MCPICARAQFFVSQNTTSQITVVPTMTVMGHVAQSNLKRAHAVEEFSDFLHHVPLFPTIDPGKDPLPVIVHSAFARRQWSFRQR
jgi:hypothetical protein